MSRVLQPRDPSAPEREGGVPLGQVLARRGFGAAFAAPIPDGCGTARRADARPQVAHISRHPTPSLRRTS